MDYKDQITEHLSVDTSNAYAMQGAAIALLGDIAYMLNDLLQSVQPAAGPPTVIDAPYASQEGAYLNCTMGNWVGEPTEYSYQWQIDGVFASMGTATFAIQADMIGKTATCILTVSNASGEASSTSNPVIVQAP